jgi:hypothetical protein
MEGEAGLLVDEGQHEAARLLGAAGLDAEGERFAAGVPGDRDGVEGEEKEVGSLNDMPVSLTATRALAHFVGSGFQTVSAQPIRSACGPAPPARTTPACAAGCNAVPSASGPAKPAGSADTGLSGEGCGRNRSRASIEASADRRFGSLGCVWHRHNHRIISIGAGTLIRT